MSLRNAVKDELWKSRQDLNDEENFEIKLQVC